jgi:hypothetical protein
VKKKSLEKAKPAVQEAAALAAQSTNQAQAPPSLLPALNYLNVALSNPLSTSEAAKGIKNICVGNKEQVFVHTYILSCSSQHLVRNVKGKEKNQLSFYYLDLFFISMYLLVELRVHIYVYISMFEYLHIYIYERWPC